MGKRSTLCPAILAVAAAGCSLGGASHVTATYTQAVERARADGLVSIHREPRVSYVCSEHAMSIGAEPLAGGPAPGVRMSYGFSYSDPRLGAPSSGTVAFVIVFAKPGYAAQCAQGGQYAFRHVPAQGQTGAVGAVQPTRRISPEILSAPGLYYDTWVVHGDAIGLGQAGNLRTIRRVTADLSRLTAQISG